MKKQYHRMLQILCAVLVLCFGAAAAAPMAYATTPEQEAVLATAQRSFNNPDGVFTVPAPETSLRLFHPGTRQAARLMASNAFEQLRTGKADQNAMRRIMAYAPIITDEELPPRGEWDDMMQYVLENGMRNIYIALRATDRPGVWQIMTLYTTRNGEVRYVPQGMEYDCETGWIYSSDVNDGIIGIGFDYNINDFMTRTAPNTWQRSFGYNRLYDLLAPLLMIYMDTLRFPFSYGGRDWMVQIWKGYYLASNGAEIGLYEKDPGQSFFWDASDTMLDMSMKVYQGDALFFDYGTQRTWWTGGFRYGNIFGTPLVRAAQVGLSGTIAFEDPDMLAAFMESFKQNKNDKITGSANGLVFSFDWQAG